MDLEGVEEAEEDGQGREVLGRGGSAVMEGKGPRRDRRREGGGCGNRGGV